MSEQAPRIFGDYELLASIGQGGMGEIFLGRSTRKRDANALVALKILPPKMSKNHAAVAMFMDEASIMAKIQHPNVLEVFEFGKELGCYYLVMEYLKGQSMATLLYEAKKKNRNFHKDEVVAFGLGAARGLSGAHLACGIDGARLGVVHRDVTPQNIFVTYDGCIKVIDFGIARATDRLTVTSTGVFKGKAAYMSPEQINVEDIDARTDVFALGVCLWEMMAGERLFFRESQMECMEAVQTLKIESPTGRTGQVDHALDQIIFQTLARDIDQRTASANDLESALEAYFPAVTPASEEALISGFMSELFEELPGEENRILGRISEQDNAGTGRLKSISGMAPDTVNDRLLTFSGRVEAAVEAEESDQEGSGTLPANGSDSSLLNPRAESVSASVEILSAQLAPLSERQAQERRASGAVFDSFAKEEVSPAARKFKLSPLKLCLLLAVVFLVVLTALFVNGQSDKGVDARSIPESSSS